MPHPSRPRVEWIFLLYLGLFVLAVLTPRAVTQSWFGFEETRIEETLIFAFGLTGLLTFSVYGKLVERRERERTEAYAERDRARKELTSSYAYIGAVNRQMDALKNAANTMAALLLRRDKKPRKDLFQSLAASAAAVVRAPHATVRIVEIPSGRTVREYHADPAHPAQAHNKHLCALHQEQRGRAFIEGDAGDILVIPSDRQGTNVTKTFLLIPMERSALPEDQSGGILNVYANQAELLHHSLTANASTATSASTEPLSLIRAAEDQVVGEVS